MNPTKLRELAERAQAWGIENRGFDIDPEHVDHLADALASAWSQVFTPPPGSVEVLVAVASTQAEDGSTHTSARAINYGTDIDNLNERFWEPVDTHRGIVTAWLPPIAPVPVVEASALPASEGEGR